MLNNDANIAHNCLANEGKDGRIVSEIWVVMEAELAEHFETSGGLMVSAKAADLNVTANGGRHGTQTITLSSGTTFAYKLHKVKDWNKGKTRINDIVLVWGGVVTPLRRFWNYGRLVESKGTLTTQYLIMGNSLARPRIPTVYKKQSSRILDSR